MSPSRGRQRKYEATHREQERARHQRWREARSVSHGKTRAEIGTRLVEQGMKCAICATKRSGGRGWHGDHDHVTGKFRGVLCHQCNVGLGHFKDDTRILNLAIRYLELAEKRHAEIAALL